MVHCSGLLGHLPLCSRDTCRGGETGAVRQRVKPRWGQHEYAVQTALGQHGHRLDACSWSWATDRTRRAMGRRLCRRGFRATCESTRGRGAMGGGSGVSKAAKHEGGPHARPSARDGSRGCLLARSILDARLVLTDRPTAHRNQRFAATAAAAAQSFGQRRRRRVM